MQVVGAHANTLRRSIQFFFNNASGYFPPKAIPFDSIIPYEQLKDKDVLEVGVGGGSHAALLAAHARTFTGIDLTETAIKNSQKRFELFALNGRLLRMDAEKMEFSNNSFDFIWSWGVIHHTSDPIKILKEMARIVRPGGMVKLMVYHRGWWNYYLTGFLVGLKTGQIKKLSNLHESIQKQTDGALARYYTKKDFIGIIPKEFSIREIYSIGPKTDIVLLPQSKFKNFLMKIIPTSLNWFLTKTLGMGCFLIISLKAEK